MRAGFQSDARCSPPSREASRADVGDTLVYDGVAFVLGEQKQQAPA